MVPDGVDFELWGEPDNINYFITTDLEAASVGAVENRSSTVSSHTRRRYVGDDSPVNVSSHDREYLYDPGRTNGSGAPGNPMILDDGTERRQFRYVGEVMDVHAWLVGEAAMDLTFFSASAKYPIAAAADTQAVKKAR